jgi:hypothetical protein
MASKNDGLDRTATEFKFAYGGRVDSFPIQDKNAKVTSKGKISEYPHIIDPPTF